MASRSGSRRKTSRPPPAPSIRPTLGPPSLLATLTAYARSQCLPERSNPPVRRAHAHTPRQRKPPASPPARSAPRQHRPPPTPHTLLGFLPRTNPTADCVAMSRERPCTMARPQNGPPSPRAGRRGAAETLASVRKTSAKQAARFRRLGSPSHISGFGSRTDDTVGRHRGRISPTTRRKSPTHGPCLCQDVETGANNAPRNL